MCLVPHCIVLSRVLLSGVVPPSTTANHAIVRDWRGVVLVFAFFASAQCATSCCRIPAVDWSVRHLRRTTPAPPFHLNLLSS